MPHVFDLFWEVLFRVLTVGISPTKSMSTENPKLGKTYLQLQMRFNCQVCMYIYVCTINVYIYIYRVFSCDYIYIVNVFEA